MGRWMMALMLAAALTGCPGGGAGALDAGADGGAGELDAGANADAGVTCAAAPKEISVIRVWSVWIEREGESGWLFEPGANAAVMFDAEEEAQARAEQWEAENCP